MGHAPGAFMLLAAAGFGSAAGSVVMSVIYCLMGESTFAVMSILFIGPAVLAGWLGWVGVRWTIRRDRRRWLDDAAKAGPYSARIVEAIRH